MKVVPTLLCGGTEKQFVALSGALDPRRFEVECACLRPVKPAALRLGDRLPLHEFPIRSFRRGASLAQQLRLAAHLWRRRTHIVHAYGFYANVFAIPAARLAGVPVVIASIRDRGPYLTPMQRRVQRYACRLADHVLVNAEAVRKWLLDDGFASEQISIVPNGVDLSRFPAVADTGAVHREFGLPPETPVIAVVSRLHRLKGLEHFLDAAAIVSRRFADARFLVVGEAPLDDRGYLDELKARAAQAGIRTRVIFAGLRHDVPELLAGATVSVMPSLDEALPNVLLESMAAGVPVVASRVGGTPEAIAGGVTGLLVPPGDAQALAASILRLLDDPGRARAMARAARRCIEERFSLERMVQATERLYHQLLTRRYGTRASSLPLDAPAHAAPSIHHP